MEDRIYNVPHFYPPPQGWRSEETKQRMQDEREAEEKARKLQEIDQKESRKQARETRRNAEADEYLSENSPEAKAAYYSDDDDDKEDVPAIVDTVEAELTRPARTQPPLNPIEREQWYDRNLKPWETELRLYQNQQDQYRRALRKEMGYTMCFYVQLMIFALLFVISVFFGSMIYTQKVDLRLEQTLHDRLQIANLSNVRCTQTSTCGTSCTFVDAYATFTVGTAVCTNQKIANVGCGFEDANTNSSHCSLCLQDAFPNGFFTSSTELCGLFDHNRVADGKQYRMWAWILFGAAGAFIILIFLVLGCRDRNLNTAEIVWLNAQISIEQQNIEEYQWYIDHANANLPRTRQEAERKRLEAQDATYFQQNQTFVAQQRQLARDAALLALPNGAAVLRARREREAREAAARGEGGGIEMMET
jgi:hypothetical protein